MSGQEQTDTAVEYPLASNSSLLRIAEPPPVLPPIESQSGADRDERYVALFVRAMQACAEYKPKFGQGRTGGVTIEQFQQLYGSDPFYSWVGLDSPLMYAAHKAAGGMTSIYRQVGIACEWIFNYVLRDSLGLNEAQAKWEYTVPLPNGHTRSLKLDGHIESDALTNKAAKERVHSWIQEVEDRVQLDAEARASIKGAVFEVRQGYKSKDSKRQNADISNAANAYASLYLPVLVLFSMQIDMDVATRYTQARWLLLNGITTGSPIDSTYVFCREVIGYDLAAFFERQSARLKNEVQNVLNALLTV